MYAVGIDKEGTKWFGTERGVNSFDGKTWRTYNHDQGLGADLKTIGEYERLKIHSTYHTQERDKSVEGYNPNFVLAIAIGSDDTKWFGTWGGGASRFDGSAFKNYTIKDGLAGNIVYSIATDRDGALWFGTNHGISRYDGKTWETLRQENGLISHDIYALSVDEDNHVWLGEKGGVDELVRQ